ncbi:hypothetical protein ACQEVX_06595 [Streptomyces syringium]|uniref:hypothetical protein n=1 Tax=Streptomyces syringium TaxID=76729 RepID=UPI003D8F79C1
MACLPLPEPGEKPISHESDEHLARKERVAKDSEDHGFHADIESQTADGHARLDVRTNGDNGIVLGYEPQLCPQTARGMRAREGFRRRGGIQSVWDFADPDHAGIGTVPYVRTPNLPASVIRVQKNPIEVQDGNFVVEEGQCSRNGALTRCPEKPYDPVLRESKMMPPAGDRPAPGGRGRRSRPRAHRGERGELPIPSIVAPGRAERPVGRRRTGWELG